MPWLAELVNPGRSNRSSQATGRILPRRDVYRADRPGGVKRRREQNIETTALYTRVASNTIREVMSPLDRLTPLTPKKNEPRDTPPAQAPRGWRVQGWRWRIFSATMDRHGVKPMPAM